MLPSWHDPLRKLGGLQAGDQRTVVVAVAVIVRRRCQQAKGHLVGRGPDAKLSGVFVIGSVAETGNVAAVDGSHGVSLFARGWRLRRGRMVAVDGYPHNGVSEGGFKLDGIARFATGQDIDGQRGQFLMGGCVHGSGEKWAIGLRSIEQGSVVCGRVVAEALKLPHGALAGSWPCFSGGA